MSEALRELEVQLELEGLQRGTPVWDKVYRSRKVAMCMDRQGVTACSDCKFFDECELTKAHARDKAEMEALRKPRLDGGSTR